MEKIVFAAPEVFEPSPAHLRILQAVSGKPGCSIGHVVQELEKEFSERQVRSGVRQLLTKSYLDGGKSFADSITLRLTSGGRILLQKAGME